MKACLDISVVTDSVISQKARESLRRSILELNRNYQEWERVHTVIERDETR